MTTRTLSLDSLRARVTALGCKLLEDNEALDDGRGYYVQLPDGLIDATASGLTPKGLAEWLLEQREAPSADTAPNPADDRSDDERFLDLVVLAGLKDRLDAMQIRKDKGVAAALEFLCQTTLTTERESAGDDDADERPDVTILAGDLSDTIRGVHGIALALAARDDLDLEAECVAAALRALTERMHDALGEANGPVVSVLRRVATVHQ